MKASNLFQAIKLDHSASLIRGILRNPSQFSGWSLQGFGMLRLYITKEVRLHIWDSRFAVENVSLLHDHPWDFESYIAAGHLTNYRYKPVDAVYSDTKAYMVSKILCGPGGGVKSEPEEINLVETAVEHFHDGSIYSQKADEIHKSVPEDGTVTVIERTFKADTEHARVFWPKGTEWVSAEPRAATPEEVASITYNALKWF